MSLTRRALLCDADGNLFPSEEPAFVASADVTNEFLASLGVPDRYDAEQLRLATTGKNFRTTAADLARTHGLRVEAAGGRGSVAVQDSEVLTQDRLQEWVDEERRRVSAHLGAVLRPDLGVQEPLRRLSSTYLLAAVSSSATPRLAACFAATGLDALIPSSRWFSAEDSLPVPTSKPDPAVYLHACRVLRVEPATSLAVEDSIPGAQSAVAAGIPTVGNLQFVAPSERPEREQLLREAGVVSIVTAWSELEQQLVEGAL